ncbi:hypothetical protein YC2023_013280 [Brassica napus]
MGVYMLSLVGGEAFRCYRGDEVMSSIDLRKKFAIKKGRIRSMKRQYLIGLKIISHFQLKKHTSIKSHDQNRMENRRHVSKEGIFSLR